MDQLPVFINLSGRKVVLIGEGEAAYAKRRLIERAGGICVGESDSDARLAFVTGEHVEEIAKRLKSFGLLVNVADRPELCDFTMPSIVDRSPVLIAVGTGGASAGLAKMLRQRMEAMLPQSLGAVAKAVLSARDSIRLRWPDAADRRRAFDDAFAQGGELDPMQDHADDAVTTWLATAANQSRGRFVEIKLTSNDPDDLTLRQARLLGEADHIFHDAKLSPALLARARADAARYVGAPSPTVPDGLILHLILPPSP